MIPEAAFAWLLVLVPIQTGIWAEAPSPWTMGAQIERETCRSFTHPQCWSPRAELKTSRENGIGFGQVTRAYNADGSIRFDKLSELKSQYKELSNWSWATRYDPHMQLKALVFMDRYGFSKFRPLAKTDDDAWWFTLSGYNGGDGHVIRDRALCSQHKGCDREVWFGNVEKHSVKSRAKYKGYGQSPYETNRSYIVQVKKRRDSYRQPWVDAGWAAAEDDAKEATEPACNLMCRAMKYVESQLEGN